MRSDVVGRIGLSPLHKCTATIHRLAYGSPADCVDEYVRIGECTATQCLQKFVRYLDKSTWEDPTTMTSIAYYILEMYEGF